MNINRNNYEEFFLLYIDGELSAQQQTAVEEFVAANPDLAAELEQLKKIILDPEENIFFKDKNSLYRTDSNSINEINCIEFFLQYADNELSSEQRLEAEKFVEANPQFSNEFNLIQHTVLEQEWIECPDKESLYKKEIKEPAPVISLSIRRIAVAASFLLFAVAAWLLTSKSIDKPAVISKNQGQSAIRQTDTLHTNAIDKSDSIILSPNNLAQKTEQKSSTDLFTNNKNNADISSKDMHSHKTAAGEKQYAQIKNEDKSVEPLILADNTTHHDNSYNNNTHINDVQTEPMIVSGNNVNSGNTAVTNIDNSRLSGVNNTVASTNTYATPVALKEIDAEKDINNRSLYVGAFNLNKDKVKGIFKKAKNLFTEKAREQADEDGKLQVAGFSINTNSNK